MDQQEIQKRVEIARELFATGGRNCAQAAALAFKDKLELQDDIIDGLTAGFARGMAYQKDVCGALSGAIMALGLILSKREGNSNAIVKSKSEALCANATEVNGSIVCQTLLDYRSGKCAKPQGRSDEQWAKQQSYTCVDYVEHAVRALAAQL